MRKANELTSALEVIFRGAAIACLVGVAAVVTLAVLPFAVVAVLAYAGVWATWTWAAPEIETARAWLNELLAVPSPATVEFPSYVAADLEGSAGVGMDNVAAVDDVADNVEIFGDVQREFDFGEDLTPSLDMADVLRIDLFPDAVFEDDFGDFEPVALPLPGAAFAAGEDAAFVVASLNPEPFPSVPAVDDDADEEWEDPREPEYGAPVGVMASAAQATAETPMERALRLVAEGSSVAGAARLAGVARSTLQARLKKLKAARTPLADAV